MELTSMEAITQFLQQEHETDAFEEKDFRTSDSCNSI
jgi:hypothetical protein